MCLAIPVKIIDIVDSMADVELNGTRTRADISLVPEATIGDYVIIHAGMAIAVYEEEEALKTLALLSEIADAMEAP